MKKEFSVILGMVVTLVVVLGVIVYLNEPDIDESDVSGGIYLDEMLILEEDIEKISVVTGSENYSLISDRGLFIIDGMDNTGLSLNLLYSIGNGFKNFRGILQEENPSDLEKYGLAYPTMSISIYTENTSDILHVGDVTDGGYFGKFVDDSSVYIISGVLVEQMERGALGFADLWLAGMGDTDYSVVHTIEMGGTVRDIPLVIESQPASEAETVLGLVSYMLTEPTSRLLAVDVVGEIAENLVPFAADYAVGFADSDNKVKYGLDNPYSTVKFTYTDSVGVEHEKTYSASRPTTDGGVFLMVDDKPFIYQAEVENIKWLTPQYPDLMSVYQLLPYIMDISEVAVETVDERHEFMLTKVVDGENVDLIVTYDGDVLDTELFRDFYQWIVGIPAEGYTELLPDADDSPLISIQYKNRATAVVDKVEIYPNSQSNDQAFLSVNGYVDAVTSNSYADIITENIENLLSGKEIVPLFEME